MERIIKQVAFPITIRPRLKRVAAYTRVSTEKDAMMHSLSMQVSYYSDLIQKHSEWQYCGVYSDAAFTGTKETRPGFQKMIEDCRDAKLDLIITKSISRFARNTVTLLEKVRELKELGVDVYFEEQNIHTLSADGELMLTILASYAQEESLSASENVKWRIRKGFERGELMNLRFLYGYTIKNSKVSINPKQAQIVREIFDRFNSGESMNGIANDFNNRNIPGTLGGTWTPEQIRCVLTNEKYLGNALLQKTYINNHIEKKCVRNTGELPQYYAEGTHEAIIDEATFEFAQRRVEIISELYSDRPRPSRSAFTGKIQCAKCGKNYRRGKNGNHIFWNCSTYLRKGPSACKCSQIPETILFQITAEVLGMDEFDQEAFQSKITGVVANDDKTLVFCFKNGTKTVKRWQHRSRAESWSAEMKEEARVRALRQKTLDRDERGLFVRAHI